MNVPNISVTADAVSLYSSGTSSSTISEPIKSLMVSFISWLPATVTRVSLIFSSVTFSGSDVILSTRLAVSWRVLNIALKLYVSLAQ